MEKEKKVVLICTTGITSGLIVRSLEKRVSLEGDQVTITSTSLIDLKETLSSDDVSGILISPQLKYALPTIIEVLDNVNIPYQIISQEAYQTINVEEILNKTKYLLKSN